jgi:hypothetical protein
MNQNLENSEHLRGLRHHLAIPKKNRSNEWEDSVGKLVGQIANDYASQPNHELAITELTLINLAAALGNKNAKKRVLKPSLWLNYPPPSLHKVLLSLDEQKIGIKSLSTIKSDWVPLYILSELEAITEKQLISIYLDWLLKYCGDLTSLLSTLNKNNFSPKEISHEDWIHALLSFFLQSGPKQIISDAFVGELLKIIFKNKTDKISLDLLQIKVYKVLNTISNYRPSILISTTMPSLLNFFKSGSDTKNKKLIALQETIAYKTLDLIQAGKILKNVDNAELSSLLIEALKKSTHKFDRIQSKFFSAELNDISNETKHESYETETSLVALISNWRDYLICNPSGKGLDQLSARFDELLEHFSIVSIGEEGMTEAYDPFKHELLDVIPSTVSTVKVVRSGFGKRREDGSTRILLKAITESA